MIMTDHVQPKDKIRLVDRFWALLQHEEGAQLQRLCWLERVRFARDAPLPQRLLPQEGRCVGTWGHLLRPPLWNVPLSPR